MPTARLAPAAALLLAGAALPAQPPAQPAAAPPAPRDTGALTRRDTVVREYTIRRAGPGDFPGGFPGAPGVRFGGPEFDVFRARREPPRSAIGVYLGPADADGLRVERVAADGPAARAGIAAGDRLLAVAGTSLRVDRAEADDPLLAAVPARRLERAVGRLAPGSAVEVRVARDGRERTVTLRTAPPEAVAERGPVVREFRMMPGGGRLDRLERLDRLAPPGGDVLGPAGPAVAGARARALVDSARARAAARPVLGLTLGGDGSARDTLGVFVAAVARGGPAERAGLTEGDRIAQVNAVDLRVSRDEQGDAQAAAARRARLTRELARLRPGERVTLRVYGDGRWRTVTAAVARAGDVYPADGPLRLGADDTLRWLAPGRLQLDVLRPSDRPMPEFFVAPLRPRAPLPPVAPAVAPRAGRRLVHI